jgi:hypothetical protein
LADPAQDQEALGRRRAELSARADERSIDWQSEVERLPTGDDGEVVAALATLLGVSIREAFNPDLSVEELERNAERSQAEHELRYRLAFGFTPEELRTTSERMLPGAYDAPRRQSEATDAS